MGANDPHCVATLDPQGLVSRVYVGEHYALQHTKLDIYIYIYIKLRAS